MRTPRYLASLPRVPIVPHRCARVPTHGDDPGTRSAYHGRVAKRVVISVRVAEADAEAIDVVRGSLSRAVWAEMVIADALAEANRPGTLRLSPKHKQQEGETCPPHPRGRVIKGFCYRCGSLVS